MLLIVTCAIFNWHHAIDTNKLLADGFSFSNNRITLFAEGLEFKSRLKWWPSQEVIGVLMVPKDRDLLISSELEIHTLLCRRMVACVCVVSLPFSKAL